MHLNAPIVGMASTPTGQGYWLVAADGGVFSYGDALLRLTGGMRLNRRWWAWRPRRRGTGTGSSRPTAASSATATPFHGSTGSIRLNQPVVGMAADAVGWWVLARRRRRRHLQLRRRALRGLDRRPPPQPAHRRHGARGPAAGGYWLVAADGGIFTFGSAPFDGSATSDINPLLVDQLASTGGAQQVLIVDAPSAASTTATLTAYENDGAGWYQVFGPMPAVDGVNGWLPGQGRIEGDGTTPEGMYAIGPTMYGTDPDPGTQFPYHQLVCGDWWDEDSGQPHLQHLPARGLRDDAALRRRLRGAVDRGQRVPLDGGDRLQHAADRPLGSGIFLHADIGVPDRRAASPSR